MTKDGVFLVNKPSGQTSHKVIQNIKRKLNINKIGHVGTLDPLATGLLVVIVNSATKISEYLLTADKGYEVEMKLFIETDSGDITGKIVKKTKVLKLKRKLIKDVFSSFNGFIYEQYPPKYSAIKINGKKLYEYTRNNEKIEIKPRTIIIHKINLQDYNYQNSTIKFTVLCSKGTYVRSLVKDLADKLNVIATITKLCRLQSGNFFLKNASNIEMLTENNLISMYDALISNGYQLILYNYEEEIKHGKPIIINNTSPTIFIINKQQDVLAIYKHIGKHVYTCQRGLWSLDNKPLKKLEKRENY